ncbi:hypothetical protein GCM10027586_09530 [Kineococcus gypseus]
MTCGAAAAVQSCVLAEDAVPELMPEGLWQRVQPLLPPRPPRRVRHPGRLPRDDRAALAGIVVVLKTNCTWAHKSPPTDSAARESPAGDDCGTGPKRACGRACTKSC